MSIYLFIINLILCFILLLVSLEIARTSSHVNQCLYPTNPFCYTDWKCGSDPGPIIPIGDDYFEKVKAKKDCFSDPPGISADECRCYQLGLDPSDDGDNNIQPTVKAPGGDFSGQQLTYGNNNSIYPNDPYPLSLLTCGSGGVYNVPTN